MKLPLFNQQIIASTHHLFVSFSEASRQILEEANTEYQKINHQCLNLSGKDLAQHRLKLFKSLKQVNVKKFRKNVQAYLADCQEYKNQTFYLNTQQTLNTDIWQQWQKDNTISQKIALLQSDWVDIKNTSHYVSESLFIITSVILPLFDAFHKLAIQELNQNRASISQIAVQNIEKYLTSLQKELEQQRLMMVEAMYARLSIAAQSNDICYDDVTHNMLQELKILGVINIECTPRRGLTQNLFQYFHQYVHKYGNALHKNKLKDLPWLKENADYVSQNIDKNFCIIPREMSSFEIPSHTKKYFPFFYSAHNFKANFFKDNFYLIAQLRLLSQKNVTQNKTLAELLRGEILEDFDQLEQKLYANAKPHKKFVGAWYNRIFRKNQCHFLNVWCDYMSKSIVDVASIKISWGIAIAKQLQTRLVFELDEEVIASNVTKMLINKLVASVDQSILNSSINHELTKQWQKSKVILNWALHHKSMPTPAKNSTELVLYQLQEQAHPDTSFVEVSNNKKDAYLELFKTLLKGATFDLNLPDFEKKLTLFCASLPEKSDDIIDLSYHHFWQQFFVVYLKTCLQNKNEALLTRLSMVMQENCSQNLQERIRSLDEVKQSRSKFLFETRCRALLFSFNCEEKNDGTETKDIPPKNTVGAKK